MGHIPEQIPETEALSIETRSASLVVYAPSTVLSVHDDGENVRLELDWETLPALRACLDQGSWVRQGSHGEPFHGVPLGFEVHGGGKRLALLPTYAAAERLAGIARRLGADQVYTRNVPAFVDPDLAEMCRRTRAAAAEGRLADEQRSWQLMVRSLTEQVPVSFATLFEGHISGVFTSQRVVAVDAERQAFRVGGVSEWMRIEAVRHASEGAGDALLAAAGDPDDLTEAELDRRLAGG